MIAARDEAYRELAQQAANAQKRAGDEIAELRKQVDALEKFFEMVSQSLSARLASATGRWASYRMQAMPTLSPKQRVDDSERYFAFWRGWLMVASAGFGIFGACWAVLGNFDPLGIYTGLLARSQWGTDEPTPEALETFAFMAVPLGATTAGYFVMVFMLVRFAFAQRERWAYWTVVAALLTWFVIDSVFSSLHGAYFNIWLVNLPCLVIMGVPLLMLRQAFAGPRRLT